MANPDLDSDMPGEGEQTSFDSARIFALAWTARRAIFVGAIAGFALGVVVLHFMPREYTSYVVLRPKQEDSVLGHGGILGGGALSGLVGMFGLGSPGDLDAFNEVLTSDALADALIRQHPDLLPTLFPGSWDERTHSYLRTGALAEAKDTIGNVLGLGPWHPPGTAELAKFLQTNVSVASDFKTKFVTISYTDKDPVFARNLVVWMYSTADDLIRKTARDGAAARIHYLHSMLPMENQVETREALIELLASEEQRMMMVQADQYFSFVPVKLPLVPSRPNPPLTKLLLTVFSLLGAFLAGAWEVFLKPRLNFSTPRNPVARLRSSVRPAE